MDILQWIAHDKSMHKSRSQINFMQTCLDLHSTPYPDMCTFTKMHATLLQNIYFSDSNSNDQKSITVFFP